MGSTTTQGTPVTNDGDVKITVTTPDSSEPLYFVDTSGVINPWYESYIYGTYQRDTNAVLGEEGSDEGDDEPESSNLCFNCGSPDHSVPACPFRRDKELISLSRQYYNFYKELRGAVDRPRIYLAEGWRQQRLEWLDTFQPGHIQNPLLREAISFGDGEWLKNIATWGYPPGWISFQDPREKVRLRIWDEHLDNGYEHSGDPFYIFGDTDEAEDVSKNIIHRSEISPGDHLVDSESQEPSNYVSKPTRWATYPSTYFSSDLLFTYTRQEAPPSSSIEWNAVFDGEDDYFYQLYGQPPPPPEDPPPIPPPPPSSTPPPIPPPPSSSPPPLPPGPLGLDFASSTITVAAPTPPGSDSALQSSRGQTAALNQEDEADMDISDSE